MNQDEYLTSAQNLTQVKPELSRDEQLGFIDNLRDTQAQQNQQIAAQTRNLGSDVPYSHGGLGGSSYFLSRYQTPQVNNMVANLKTAAQQTALNTALKNYQENLKDRYNQAYRSAQKRAAAKTNTPQAQLGQEYVEGEVKTEVIPEGETVEPAIRSQAPGATVISIDPVTGSGEVPFVVLDNESGNQIGAYKKPTDGQTYQNWVDTQIKSQSDAYYQKQGFKDANDWYEQLKKANPWFAGE